MSDGLCEACSLNDHQHHKLALGGICIGCVCGFRPVARRHEVLDRERRLDAEAEVERLKAELAREANAHAGTASSHARLKAELNAERERHHATLEAADLVLKDVQRLERSFSCFYCGNDRLTHEASCRVREARRSVEKWTNEQLKETKP